MWTERIQFYLRLLLLSVLASAGCSLYSDPTAMDLVQRANYCCNQKKLAYRLFAAGQATNNLGKCEELGWEDHPSDLVAAQNAYQEAARCHGNERAKEQLRRLGLPVPEERSCLRWKGNDLVFVVLFLPPALVISPFVMLGEEIVGHPYDHQIPDCGFESRYP